MGLGVGRLVQLEDGSVELDDLAVTAADDEPGAARVTAPLRAERMDLPGAGHPCLQADP